MLEILTIILKSVVIGILFALPGIAFGAYLEKKGIALKHYPEVLALSILSVFIKQIWYPDASYTWFTAMLILATTVGLYRTELYWANQAKKNKQEETSKD